MSSVLIVEDDLALRDSLEDTISELGYITMSASDGREALSLLSSGLLPRLILLDLMMPAMNGYQFRDAQVRDPALRRIPTVVMSAAQNLANADIDADELLPKPIRFDLLENALLRFVGPPPDLRTEPRHEWRLVASAEDESCRWGREDGHWLSIVIDAAAGAVFLRDSHGGCEPAHSFEQALASAAERRRR